MRKLSSRTSSRADKSAMTSRPGLMVCEKESETSTNIALAALAKIRAAVVGFGLSRLVLLVTCHYIYVTRAKAQGW